MKFKQIMLVGVLSFISAFMGIVIYLRFFERQQQIFISHEKDHLPAHYSKYFNSTQEANQGLDFTKAADVAVPAVVHIKTKIPAQRASARTDGTNDFLRNYLGLEFGDDYIPEQRASGSGVIISDNGYIITNNHVITDANGNIADDINVTIHSGKTYKAKVIGRSETTDLAVLKINDKQLPHMLFGNSDLLQTGQWVLAVGYPLSLEATVTAGIISATGRSFGFGSQIKNNERGLRSFIQTDAAVNSGNSGGALVNTHGELIGINSAIISPTGTYAGYSFAIPVNTVKKAVKEMIGSGEVEKRS
jgi:serine protease Do